MRPKAVKVRAVAMQDVWWRDSLHSAEMFCALLVLLQQDDVRPDSLTPRSQRLEEATHELLTAVNLLLPEFIVLEGGEKISFGEGEWRDVHTQSFSCKVVQVLQTWLTGRITCALGNCSKRSRVYCTPALYAELQERLHTTYNNGDPERKDASGRNKHWTPCGWIKKCAEIQSKKENWGRCVHGGPWAPAKKRKLSARNLSMVS